MTYKELLNSYSSIATIPYSFLLMTDEWMARRQEIIRRDNHKCSKCDQTETINITSNNVNYNIRFEGEEPVIFNDKGTFEAAFLPAAVLVDRPYYLQVHHRYYIIDVLPWEYKDEVLITLCHWCHSDLHRNEKVQVYDKNNAPCSDYLPCDRCGGDGWFPEFTHVQGGVCFKCGGRGFNKSLFSLVVKQ